MIQKLLLSVFFMVALQKFDDQPKNWFLDFVATYSFDIYFVQEFTTTYYSAMLQTEWNKYMSDIYNPILLQFGLSLFVMAANLPLAFAFNRFMRIFDWRPSSKDSKVKEVS